MLRLHGFASSNYHNLVKAVLLEKEVDFEEMTTYPPADDAHRSRNPTGKYPCLEIEPGVFLGESRVILEYLEDAHPHAPLLPEAPLDRARAREVMAIVDLYLELPARRLYPEALFQQPVADSVKREARAVLETGASALAARARFEPYVAGADLSLADFSAALHLPVVSIACRAIYGEDLLGAVPGLAPHRERMKERKSLQQVAADRRADVPRFLEHQAAVRPPSRP